MVGFSKRVVAVIAFAAVPLVAARDIMSHDFVSDFVSEDLTLLSAPQRHVFERIEVGDVTKREIEIVLAECDDDLSWVRPEYEALVTVQERCGSDTSKAFGRESGAYLEHIVEHYDSLAEWTVFSQAHAPTPGYLDAGVVQDQQSTVGGHLLHGSTFDDYVCAAGSGAPFYQPVSTMVDLRDATNYRHNVRTSFFIWSDVLADRDTWGAKACPTTVARDGDARGGSASRGFSLFHDKHDEFVGWIDLVVATHFPRLLRTLQAATGAGRRVRTAEEYFKELVCTRNTTTNSCPHVLLFGQGARFGVSAASIRAKPKAYYEALLAEVAWSADPYQSFYNEWMWSYIVADGPAPACANATAIEYANFDGSDEARRFLSGTTSSNTISTKGSSSSSTTSSASTVILSQCVALLALLMGAATALARS